MNSSKEMKSVFNLKGSQQGKRTVTGFNSANTLSISKGQGSVETRDRSWPQGSYSQGKPRAANSRPWGEGGLESIWWIWEAYPWSGPWGWRQGCQSPCQCGGEVAELVTGPQWDWNCNQGDKAR